ncbi:MAG: BtpA/SgcQ family protein [Nanoarchaeota archaeon]|nr:BtpA/SgcQ family protein [Nanoarchaeota archaeon]MBU1030287.1 BtpA/SgcQ family protein [Nanoarchaeota archaeon]MBU1849300.1 BtpA/SgcQ family protein [Nanoarchaeota archaeon]
MKIIGMIHLDSLPGYPQHKTMKSVVDNALKDAEALEKGGVDAILLENTYDDPHTKKVGAEIIAAYTAVALEVKRAVKIPIGICVLWNDYKAALAIAKVVGATFVRVPIFIEAAVTASGIIEGEPYNVISYRKKLDAENIGILADVQVKHAGHLVTRAIEDSAMEAIDFQADQLIITGKRTGDSPVIDDLKRVRKALPKAIIVVGSGTTPENIKELSRFADAVIVGTFFKKKGRIDETKVKLLISKNSS